MHGATIRVITIFTFAPCIYGIQTHYYPLFKKQLGAFSKLEQAAISVVMSVCLSVCLCESPYVCCFLCFFFLTLNARLLATGQYSEVLRPAISTQAFLCFPVPKSKC